ncbi:hypothetical protein CGRA01v4_11735 [Colletotrichum graminicola]|nr:hypothetical protein CGRA01v4_11735 [Colletotrichum graminicola]
MCQETSYYSIRSRKQTDASYVVRGPAKHTKWPGMEGVMMVVLGASGRPPIGPWRQWDKRWRKQALTSNRWPMLAWAWRRYHSVRERNKSGKTGSGSACDHLPVCATPSAYGTTLDAMLTPSQPQVAQRLSIWHLGSPVFRVSCSICSAFAHVFPFTGVDRVAIPSRGWRCVTSSRLRYMMGMVL